MILLPECCILVTDRGKRSGGDAAVAQLVERGKTGLGKDLNSNPYHLFSGVVAGSIPVSAAAFNFFPSPNTALLWKKSSATV